MAGRFIAAPRSTFTLDVPEGKGKDKVTTLTPIYGDEIDQIGQPANGVAKANYRGRTGTISAADLDDERRLQLFFFDVGQGDCTLIVTPKNKKILVDGGQPVAKGRRSAAEQALAWQYRLDEVNEPLVIDLVVLTHADEDHIGGLINLLSNPKFVVKRVVHSGIATYNKSRFPKELGSVQNGYLRTLHHDLTDLDRQSLTGNFASWALALDAKQTDYHSVHAGDTLDVGDPTISIDVLAPIVEQNGAGADQLKWFGDKAHTINGHSVVLRVTYDEVRILLTGDLNIQGSQALLRHPVSSGLLDAHVLKAPHHGSHEFEEAFLLAVNPQITSISSGEYPDYGHPRPEFLAVTGRCSRGPKPLLYSTALSAVFRPEEREEIQAAVDNAADTNTASRQHFVKLIEGIVNVRTNGKTLFAATRINASTRWVTYPDLALAERTPG